MIDVSKNDDCIDDDDDDDDEESVKFVCMHICIPQYDNEKFLSSDIWPKGITIRPWVSKPKHNDIMILSQCSSISNGQSPVCHGFNSAVASFR